MSKISNILIWGGILLTTIGCGGWLRPVHLTPKDALIEYPGYLTDANTYISSSVTILQQHPFGDGVILLYRWQSPTSQQTNSFCLATTYVEPGLSLKGKGWQPYASTFLTVETEDMSVTDNETRVFNRDCEIPASDFVAGYIVRGEKSEVTTTSGFSGKGVAVQVVWSDGQVDQLPLDPNGSFFLMRQGRLDVHHIDLLSADNQILARKTW